MLSDETWSKIFVDGLQNLFLNDLVFRESIISIYPEILNEIIFSLNKKTQYEIIKVLFDSDKESLKDEFWKKYISKSTSSLASISSAEDSYWLMLINKIREDVYEEKVDWFYVASVLSENISCGRLYEDTVFLKIMETLIAKDKTYLKKLLYKTETKKYSQPLKLNLYSRVIKLGLLDKKLARRIRSDTSGILSKQLLVKLFICRKSYSDADFKELITLFNDTKHKWVAQFICMNMPKDLIPFLMGISDPVSSKILERRLNN
jgi:hypothetical protein